MALSRRKNRLKQLPITDNPVTVPAFMRREFAGTAAELEETWRGLLAKGYLRVEGGGVTMTESGIGALARTRKALAQGASS